MNIPKQRILLIHNYYQDRGGEDLVFAAEKDLLLRNGHDVVEYVDSNDRIESMSRLSAARELVWSSSTYNALKKLLAETLPDVAHFHNTFLVISPSAYYACKEMGVPVVQTLHNYRLFCPSAVLYRDGHVCEDCLRKLVAWPGVWHSCYRNSRAQSGAVAFMLFCHRVLGTWRNKVDIYIALSEFARRKFIEGGLASDKIIVKPNFMQGSYTSREKRDNYALFAGRLSSEKGILTALRAWQHLNDIPLKVVGDGPQGEQVKRISKNLDGIELLGHQDRNKVLEMMQAARCLVIPSECYENFPLALLEAFACATPVIAARIGSLAELVKDGETGLLFNPGDSNDLAAKVDWLWNHPQEARQIGQQAQLEFKEKYTPEYNYQTLMNTYALAVTH